MYSMKAGTKRRVVAPALHKLRRVGRRHFLSEIGTHWCVMSIP